MKRLFTTLAVLAMACSAFAQQTELERVRSPKGISEKILVKKGFTVSYNPSLKIPNWVSWELTKDEASATKVSRTDEFVADPALKGHGCTTYDYAGSGFDRGHMAPAADMKWDSVAMVESFYLTNICPQVKSVNEGLWLELEQKCRYWAKQYGSIYIVCGPMFMLEEARYIGDSEVAVPDAFFKVVLQKRKGRWYSMGFVIPNTNMYNTPLEKCAFPVNSIEEITGYDFFAALPDNIEEDVEAAADITPWIIAGWNK